MVSYWCNQKKKKISYDIKPTKVAAAWLTNKFILLRCRRSWSAVSHANRCLSLQISLMGSWPSIQMSRVMFATMRWRLVDLHSHPLETGGCESCYCISGGWSKQPRRMHMQQLDGPTHNRFTWHCRWPFYCAALCCVPAAVILWRKAKVQNVWEGNYFLLSFAQPWFSIRILKKKQRIREESIRGRTPQKFPVSAKCSESLSHFCAENLWRSVPVMYFIDKTVGQA